MSERNKYGVRPLATRQTRDEDERLASEIDSMLRQIEEIRQETRKDDEEVARLGEETRRLIDEMLRDLNLKAA